MRTIIFVLTFVFLPQASAENIADPKVEVATCINYDKFQDIHPSHYWDGKIHLVPMYDETGKKFVGYAVVHMPKDSPFVKRGFKVGDLLTELDGVSFTPPAPNSDSSKIFAKIKSNSFKSAKIERCQKLNLKY